MMTPKNKNKKGKKQFTKLAVLAVLGIGLLFGSLILKNPTQKSPEKQENKTLLQQLHIQGADIVSVGCDNASVLMIEFTDLACPFSERFFLTTFPKIYNDYIKTCKVKYIIKDAPIPQLHGIAPFYAAQLLRCIYVTSGGNFTLYWYNRNITYITARDWDKRNATFHDVIKYLLNKLYIPRDIYDKTLNCILYNETASAVYRDYIEAFKVARIPGTPSFLFVVPKKYLTDAEKAEIVDYFSKYYNNMAKAIMEENGYYLIPVVGALPYEDFKFLLDRITS